MKTLPLRYALSISGLLAFVIAAGPAAAATLKVSSFPSGAQVSVDGISTGKATPMNITLPEGDHVVTVQIPASGWNPDTRVVTIVLGNNDLSVTLLPTPTPGPPGPKGDTGPTGATGPQGAPGEHGAVTRAAPPCFNSIARYADCGNGTVTDTVTGLIWLKDAACMGLADWAVANGTATALASGQCGLTDASSAGDWRLPTKEEWSATIASAALRACVIRFGTSPALTNDAGTACLAIGPSSFTGVASSAYWSSSTSEANAVNAYMGYLDLAGVSYAAKTEIVNVWPVRAGK